MAGDGINGAATLRHGFQHEQYFSFCFGFLANTVKKSPCPFPVPQDAAPQPADVVLLSNSEAGNGSCLC